jgi:crossover junction endodeoxyribonuclease RuvC
MKNKARATTIIGIDPGLTGAVSILWPDKHITIEDTPTMAVKKAGGKIGTEYLPREMANILQGLEANWSQIYIEAVHSMPKQGVSSTFTFGKGYGIWIGIIAAFGIPVTFVTPQKWKKALMQGIHDKDAARLRAQQLYPSMMPQLKLKKHVGRADALLIMHYGAIDLGLKR